MADHTKKIPAQEYSGNEFVENYAKTSKEYLWMNTTFYTFANFVTSGGQNSNILQGASVLDLGCGEGIFSRWAVSQGASRVVGVDLSEGQISQARNATDKTNSKIEYMVGDVLAAGFDESLHGQFDVIIAVHVICYATNTDILNCMLKSAMSCLKKGGKMFGVRECLDSAAKGPAVPYIKGEIEGGPMFLCQIDHPQMDFTPSTHTFRNGDGSIISFVNYMVFEATMIKAFTTVGFEIETVGPLLTCSPEGMKLFPSDFLRKMLDEWGKMMWYFKVTKPNN